MRGETKKGRLAIGLLLAILAAAMPALAGEVVSAQDIAHGLTRSIGVAPRINPQGYAVPEASPYVSLDTIQFDLDSARLRPQAKRQLDEVAKALGDSTLAGNRVLVEGHTCDRGAFDHNMALSERRAQAVKAYLATKGIDPGRIEIKGWGETRRIAPGADEASRSRNRRVDFVKLEAAGKPAVTRGLRTRGLPGDAGLLDAGFKAVNGGKPRTPENGRVALPSGGQFHASFRALQGCHVYALFHSSQGETAWLLPPEPDASGQWFYVGAEHTIPAPGRCYTLDNNPGTEVLAIIASPGPAASAERLTQRFAASPETATAESLGLPGGAEVHRLILDHRHKE